MADSEWAKLRWVTIHQGLIRILGLIGSYWILDLDLGVGYGYRYIEDGNVKERAGHPRFVARNFTPTAPLIIAASFFTTSYLGRHRITTYLHT